MKSGKRKRKEVGIEQRREAVSRMYRRGIAQWKIAQKFGVTQQTISIDLKTIREQWRESAIRDFDSHREEQLAKLDEIEREAWNAWQQSKQDAITHVGGISADKTVDKTTTAKQVGDPRYLQIVKDCIERRCKMLGLDAPEKIEHGGKLEIETVKQAIADLSDAELEAMHKFGKRVNLN